MLKRKNKTRITSSDWRECKKTTPGQDWRDLPEKGVVKASYEVALVVAKSVKAHTISESLLMPAAKILVKNVIRVEAAAKLETVSVCNNTVKNRIEMSIDIAD